jgi:hypothetical protein
MFFSFSTSRSPQGYDAYRANTLGKDGGRIQVTDLPGCDPPSFAANRPRLADKIRTSDQNHYAQEVKAMLRDIRPALRLVPFEVHAPPPRQKRAATIVATDASRIKPLYARALPKAAERTNFDASSLPQNYAVLKVGRPPHPRVPKNQAAPALPHEQEAKC